MNSENKPDFLGHILFSKHYSTPKEASEALLHTEANLPDGSESRVMPSYDTSLRQTIPSTEPDTCMQNGVQDTNYAYYPLHAGGAMSTESLSPHTPSDCTSNATVDYEYAGGDYETDPVRMESDGMDSEQHAKHLAASRVIGGLDEMLRERVETEMRGFEMNLHDLLNEHVGHIHNVVSNTMLTENEADDVDNVQNMTKLTEEESDRRRDLDCYRCLTTMFTNAAVISNAFQTKKMFQLNS